MAREQRRRSRLPLCGGFLLVKRDLHMFDLELIDTVDDVSPRVRRIMRSDR